MIVDDSIVVRAIIARMLAPYPDLEVVGSAGNADQALRLLAKTKVDVILLDLQMPGQDGLSALPRLIEESAGARILIVSSFCEAGAGAAIRALTLGAADTLLKPMTGSIGAPFADELLRRVRRLGHAPAAEPDRTLKASTVKEALSLSMRPARSGPIGCLAIGASTGGPHALSAFFAALPDQFTAPIVLTQHLPAVFMPYFAGQLAEIARRPTSVAEEGRPLRRGEIVVAPGEAHLVVRRTGKGVCTGIERGPAPSGGAPSVDPMFESVAAVFGTRAVGVVLTGMGRDGAQGAAHLAEAGGEILVQDAASSVVWGMPGAIARAGHASLIGPPGALAERIAQRARAASWN